MPRALVLLIYILFFLNQFAFALEAPLHTKQEIVSILAQKEFQPRGEKKGYFDDLKKDIEHWMLEKLTALKESLEEFLEISGINKIQFPILDKIGNFISKIVQYFFYFFNYFLAAVVILIVYLCFKFLLKKESDPKSIFGNQTLTTKIEEINLDQINLNQNGLEQLRRLLREAISKKYKIDSFYTDREAQKSIDSNDKLKNVFSEVILLFEKVFFANCENEIPKMEKLLKEVKTLKAAGHI